MDNNIIEMYKEGYSINYIAKRYNKYINDQKYLKIENNLYFTPKKYSMKYCREYVYNVIYNYFYLSDSK